MENINIIKSLFNHPNDNLTITKLGGMTNKNYLVSNIKGGGEFVVRIAGSMTYKLINRENECFNSIVTSKKGINVETIFFDKNTGTKVTSFLPNAISLTHKSIKNKKTIQSIAKKIKELHFSNIVFNNEFNVFSEFEKYLGLLKNKDLFFSSTPYIDKLLKTFEYYKTYFNIQNKTLSPCHNDLVPENILIENNNIYIIDWEYSGMNDPLFEIASFFLECNLSEFEQDLFLKEYFSDKNKDFSNIKKEIHFYQFTQDILWFVWTLIKEENNENFGDYGNKRLSRAIKHIKNTNVLGL